MEAGGAGGRDRRSWVILSTIVVWLAGCGTVTPVRPGSVGQVDFTAGPGPDAPPEAAPRYVALDPPGEQRALLAAIRRGLDNESAMLAVDVDVAATGPGQVVLTGEVDNGQLSRRAEEIAAAVWGVTKVRNELRVLPPLGSESEVAGNVRSALAADPALEEATLEVAMSGGLLTLRGWVSRPELADRAERVAAGIAGVIKVDNQIASIPRLPPPSHGQLLAEVRRRVRAARGVDARRVTVAVDRRPRIVRLAGFVDSFDVRRRLLTAAWTSGVDDVDAGNLRVVWRGDQVGREVPAARVERVPAAGGTITADDQTLAAQVRGALARDPYLDSVTINVRAEAGHVHLEGWVDAPFEAERAAAVASTVAGVDRITNSLRLLLSPDRE